MKRILETSLFKYHTAAAANSFQLANEVDAGQETTNPFILCTRALKSGSPVSLETLNSILAFNGICISQSEYEYLTGIKPTLLPKFPLPVNDDAIIQVIGSATKKGKTTPKYGVYLIESLDNSSKYVGSSSMLAMRLRYYYSKKGLAENRPIAKSLVSNGLDMFTISVFLIEPSEVAKLGVLTSLSDLTLAFEQLMILRLNPNLNAMTVVNGPPSVHSTYKQVGKPVYIYNSTMDTLLYTTESAMQMEKEINITSHTVSRNMKSGIPMYGKFVFTRSPIKGATVSVMTSAALRAELDWCYKNRAQLRDYTKPTSNMIPILLTDMEDANKSYSFVSKRKACLYTEGYPDRRVTHLDVLKFKLPFTYKGWRFEHHNSTPTDTHIIKERRNIIAGNLSLRPA